LGAINPLVPNKIKEVPPHIVLPNAGYQLGAITETGHVHAKVGGTSAHHPLERPHFIQAFGVAAANEINEQFTRTEYVNGQLSTIFHKFNQALCDRLYLVAQFSNWGRKVLKFT
jgi:hypothetical protein